MRRREARTAPPATPPGRRPLHAMSAASTVYAGVPPVNDLRTGLAQRGIEAFLWGTGGSVLRMALQLGTQIALARILGPEVYGLFAIGVLVIGVSNYLADFGLAYSLIQKPEVRPADVAFVWTLQVLLGLVVGGAMFAAAGPLAAAFDKEAAADMFRMLALVCLFNAMASPSTNLLKKTLDHRWLQLALLLAYVVGYFLVGLPLALAGAGIDSLVAAMVVQAVAQFVLLYARVRHPLAPRLAVDGGWQMLRYGAMVLATNLVNWVLTSADRLAVGRFFPASVVGLYATAYNLVNAPAAAGYATTQSVVFAACARLQGDPRAMYLLLKRLLATVAVVVFPLFAVASAGAEVVVAAVYGPSWREAAPFLAVFALGVPWMLVWGISTPVLWNTGRQRLEMTLQLPLAVLWCVVLWAVASSGALTFAFAAAGLLAFRSAVAVLLAGRQVGLGARALATMLLRGALVTLAVWLACAAMARWMAVLDWHAWVALPALLATGSLVLALVLLAGGRHLIDAALADWLAVHVTRLPTVLHGPVRRALGSGGGG